MISQVEPDEIERKIIAALDSMTVDESLWIDSRPKLTRIFRPTVDDTQGRISDEGLWKAVVIRRLSSLGLQLQLRSDGADREWMYDVIWRDVNTSGDWGVTKSVPLVLCCDFWISGHSRNPSFEPLDKLMVARAERRVFVCQHPYPESVFERFVSYLAQCEMTKKKDRYMFLCYVAERRAFSSRVVLA